MAPATTYTLPTGAHSPLVGFGLWKVTENTAEVVYNALKAGYRLLDGAADYNNEVEAGKGLKRAIEEGIVKREDVFITSKLWVSPDIVERASRSLQLIRIPAPEHLPCLRACRARREEVARRLGHRVLRLIPHSLPHLAQMYVRFHLIFDRAPLTYSSHLQTSTPMFAVRARFIFRHVLALTADRSRHPDPPEWDDGKGVVTLSDEPIHLTWKGMEDVFSAGLAKAIGVSNFSGGLLIDLHRYAKVKPAVLQIEQHPYFTQPQLVELAKTLGVAVTACEFNS